MKPLLVSLVVLASLCTIPVGTVTTLPASQTLTGQLSDGTCRWSHDALAGPAGLTALACARVCVEYGSGYVLVTAVPIANPDFPGLQALLGQRVQVTGEQTDEAIIVSKIELSEPEHGRSASVGTIGQLSDDRCRLSHDATAAQAGLTDQECARLCVERGSAYVFVTALPIANPDFPGLEALLGQDVELTGERTGDAIVVSKVELSQ